MQEEISDWRYLLIGAGPAAAAAVVAIRSCDREGSLLMLGAEAEGPYQRPPLSKGLWLGKDHMDDLPLKSPAEWEALAVQRHLGDPVRQLDATARKVTTAAGKTYTYHHLLLATGGRARRPRDLPPELATRVFTLRSLDDYEGLRAALHPGLEVLVVGGGFLGAEMAAALSQQKGLSVHYAVAGAAPLAHILPPVLQKEIGARYEKAGVVLHPQHRLAELSLEQDRLVARFDGVGALACDLLIYAAGMEANVELAQQAGLTLSLGGVRVDAQMRSSDPHIWVAGDLASYPDPVWQVPIRLEHWDNAEATGRAAGLAMAGAGEPFTHQSLFFSDLYEFGFEAVGRCEVQRVLRVAAERGGKAAVVYYGERSEVQGVLLWNLWDKVDTVRAGIADRRPLDDPFWRRSLEAW